MDLRDKVVIVTGSATGVGEATALQLAAKGARVVVNYTKSEAEARDTASRCEQTGGQALLCQADVSQDADCRRMVQETVDQWGRLDALVNNAGTTKQVDHKDLEGLSAEDFQRIYAVNVIGAYQMTRAAAPHLKASGAGAVVNVSSIAGVMGVGSSIAYAASKGALNIMTKSLARALGPEIRVNAVCPGAIRTRWLETLYGTERYNKLMDAYAASAPLQNVSEPEDVAEVIVALIATSRLVTGETVLIDGGFHLGGLR
jgi:3-oxoacyl-[acyl-carrier protein] reductase